MEIQKSVPIKVFWVQTGKDLAKLPGLLIGRRL